MSDRDPAERLLDRIRGEPADADHADVLLAIPLIYGTGLGTWWLFGVHLTVVVVVSSLFALGILIEALFLYPPRV